MSDSGKQIRRSRDLLKRRSIDQVITKRREEDAKEALRIFKLLPQGPGSGLDADTVDGLHAKEIISKASGQLMPGSGEGGGGVTDHGALTGLADDDHPQYMKESVFDANSDNVVDNSEDTQAIDGKTLDAENPSNGQVLVYDSASGTWKPLDPDVTIVDVDIPAQTTDLKVTLDSEVATVAPSGDMARKALYDRNMSVGIDDYSGQVAAHAWQERTRVTVPANKKMLQGILYLETSIAIQNAGTYSIAAFFVNVGGAGEKRVAQVILTDNPNYFVSSLTTTALFYLNADDYIIGKTYNNDGIAHNYALGCIGTVFDE